MMFTRLENKSFSKGGNNQEDKSPDVSTGSYLFSIEGGFVEFGYNLRARIFSGHWYHLGVVLNGTREERLGAVAVYLNGMLVGTAPGRLSLPPEKLQFGSKSLTWEPRDNTIESYSIRLQLVVALKVSSQGLDGLLLAMGINLEEQVIVDTSFLRHMLRFSRFVNLFGISGKEMINFLQITTGTSELPYNKPSDVMYLSRLVQWLFKNRGIPPALLSDFFEKGSITDSLIINFASLVCNEDSLPLYTVSQSSFVNIEKKIDLSLSEKIYDGIKTFLDLDPTLPSTVISRIRGFGIESLRNDIEWERIFRPVNADPPLLDDFAKQDLEEGLSNKQVVMERLVNSGFLLGPKMTSSKIFDFKSLRRIIDPNNSLGEDMLEKWNLFLPQWIVKWAYVKEHIEAVILNRRNALDQKTSVVFAEIFGEEIGVAETIDLDTNYDYPLFQLLNDILSQKESPDKLRLRILKAQNEASTFSSIKELSTLVMAQSDSFTITEDSFVTSVPNINIELSKVIFSALYQSSSNIIGLFLDGSTRSVVQRLRGITADTIRKDKYWKELFRPDMNSDEKEGILDTFARKDLLLEKTANMDNEFVSTVMKLLTSNDKLSLFGPEISSSQHFDVTPIRDSTDPQYTYPQFWNITLPSWIRKWTEIKETIEKIFADFRQALDNALTQGIAEIFDLDDDSATVINYDSSPEMPIVRQLKGTLSNNKVPSNALKNTVSEINNTATLVNAAGLDLSEMILLLKLPTAFEVSRITFNDLISVTKYVEIRELVTELSEEDSVVTLDESVAKLWTLLENLTGSMVPALNSIGLDKREIEQLQVNNILSTNFDISSFWRACRLVKLMRRTGASLELILALGKQNNLNENEFARWNALVSSLAASLPFENRNNDTSIKEKLFSATQVKLRDALLGIVTHRYQNGLAEQDINAVNSSTAISNFLLVDVLTGPKVLVSRVQQAISSI